MEFTVWADSDHTDKNGSDARSAFGSETFDNSMSNELSSHIDNKDAFKSQTSHADEEFNLGNDSFEQDGLQSWNLISSDITSSLTQDQQQLLWDDEYSGFGAHDSIHNGKDGEMSPSDKNDVDDKMVFSSDRFGTLPKTDTPSQRPSLHKRELSDTLTMRVPLVTRSHGDNYDDSGDPLYSTHLKTPQRSRNASGHKYLQDGFPSTSPNYFINGLDSPMESPALQSPYLAYQPFPMLPTTSGTGSGVPSSSVTRKLSSAGSPKNRRKSSSASQTSVASPLACEEPKQPDSAPQTPRARAAGVTKSKHKKTQSSVSVTPKSSSTSESSNGMTSTSHTTPLRNPNQINATPTTASNTPAVTPNQSLTPGREGKKDGRKRIAKEQIDILEAFFHKNPRPEREDRLRLAAETNLEQRTVQIWFQNRRAKSRSMKMPPSKADTSMSAMQYRAAAAAATNAAAASTSGFGKPNINSNPQGVDYDYYNANGLGLSSSQLPRYMPNNSYMQHNLGMMGAANENTDIPDSRQYLGHHRWNSVSTASPTTPMANYHQQLPKHGVPQTQAMAAQVQRIQQMQQLEQMQHLQQVQQARQMQQRMQPQFQQQTRPPPMNRSNSLSMFEPYMNYRDQPEMGFDNTMPHNDLNMVNTLGRSDSMLSLTSMNSGISQSPIKTDNMMAFSPNMRSLQNSPELVSPVAWPSSVGRNNSTTINQGIGGGSVDYSGSPAASEIKRRRSLYGNTAPVWNYQYDTEPAPSSRTSPTSSSEHSNSTGGSLAASAAAAALRSRNRSYTQPIARSRQSSVRLHLDESNNAAQLVVLPDEQVPDLNSQKTYGNGSFQRDLSPGRAERAAERVLAERAAAATMGRVKRD